MNGVNETLHGMAPAAEPLSQAQMEEQRNNLQKELDAHCVNMSQAKKLHEKSLERAKELRQALVDAERIATNSPYERMMDVQHQLMSRIQNLNNLLACSRSRNTGGK